MYVFHCNVVYGDEKVENKLKCIVMGNSLNKLQYSRTKINHSAIKN